MCDCLRRKKDFARIKSNRNQNAYHYSSATIRRRLKKIENSALFLQRGTFLKGKEAMVLSASSRALTIIIHS